MLDIKIKDIRVLPGSLDLKNNAGKSLSEILGQLQSGSIVKGLVVGTTPSGEAIFHTAHGRFAAKNDINLVRGDTISLKLVHTTSNVSGTIISVNDKKQDATEPLKLNIANSQDASKNTSTTSKSSNAVSVSNISDIPKSFDGEISYLNLSKTNKYTPLYRALNSVTTTESTKTPISLNIISGNQSSNSAFIVSGEVSGNTKNRSQLIRTNFGVILSKNTNMPTGQKLSLEITSINNQSLTKTINKGVSDFLFIANKNWPLLNNLTQATGGNRHTLTSQFTTNSQIVSTLPSSIANSSSSTTNSSQLVSPLPTTEKTTRTENNRTQQSSAIQPSTSQPVSDKVAPLTSAITAKEEFAAKLAPRSLNLETRELIANAEKIQIGTRSTRSKDRSATQDKEIQFSKNLDPKNNDTQLSSPTLKKEQTSINSIIRGLGEHEEIRKLSSELINLKELILPSVREGETPEKLQTILVPFYNGKNVQNHEVKIDRSSEHFLRFIVDVNLIDNPMQIDGLIRFENDNKTPRTFDMTVRSKKPLDPAIQSRIADIYQLNQNMSGVRGNLSIEQQGF